MACLDFFSSHGINPTIEKIDNMAVYWKKTEQVGHCYSSQGQSTEERSRISASYTTVVMYIMLVILNSWQKGQGAESWSAGPSDAGVLYVVWVGGCR